MIPNLQKPAKSWEVEHRRTPTITYTWAVNTFAERQSPLTRIHPGVGSVSERRKRVRRPGFSPDVVLKHGRSDRSGHQGHGTLVGPEHF